MSDIHNTDSDDDWSEWFDGLGEFESLNNQQGPTTTTSTTATSAPVVTSWRFSIRLMTGSDVLFESYPNRNNPKLMEYSYRFVEDEWYATFEGPNERHLVYIDSESMLTALFRHIKMSARPIHLSMWDQYDLLKNEIEVYGTTGDRRVSKLKCTLRLLFESVKDQIETIRLPAYIYPLLLMGDYITTTEFLSSLRHVAFELSVEQLQRCHVPSGMFPTSLLPSWSGSNVSIHLVQYIPGQQFEVSSQQREVLDQFVVSLFMGVASAQQQRIVEIAYIPYNDSEHQYDSCFSMDTIQSILLYPPHAQQHQQPIALTLRRLQIALPHDMKSLSNGISKSSILLDLQLHLCDLENDDDDTKYRQLFAAVTVSTSIEKFALTCKETMSVTAALYFYEMLLQKPLRSISLVRQWASFKSIDGNPDYGAYALMKGLLASYHLQRGLLKLEHLHLGCPSMDFVYTEAYAKFDQELCTRLCSIGDDHSQYVRDTSSWRPRGHVLPKEKEEPQTVDWLLNQALQHTNCCLLSLDVAGSGYLELASLDLLSVVLPTTTTMERLNLRGVREWPDDDDVTILDRRIEHMTELAARCHSLTQISIEKGSPCLRQRLDKILRFNARRKAIQNPCQTKEDIICILDEYIDDVPLLYETLRLASFVFV